MRPFKHPQRDPKPAVLQRSASDLAELEKTCIEKWEKMLRNKLCKAERDTDEMTQSCNCCQGTVHIWGGGVVVFFFLFYSVTLFLPFISSCLLHLRFLYGMYSFLSAFI